ncbi:hypothetical protein [Streptomyces sp. NBC_00829]|uniref:hypothetical protein n=1 Tax=Streptomyces sp. NBC_00829 TaxID=2903679 RepID=UPI003865C440|nr:hypothetical protein OG293_04125 [Streptomyces sp. NBC_00829]
MASTQKQRTTVDKVREAETVRDELSTSLRAVGIVLPSLRIDPASCMGTAPPLIELSRCNLETARKLTAALAEKAA